MGAWGYGAFDSDEGLDFISLLFNEEAIAKALNEESAWGYDSIRAAGEVLVHLSRLRAHWVSQKTLDGMVDCLKSVLDDAEWLKGWDDGGEEVKRSIKALVDDLEALDGY